VKPTISRPALDVRCKRTSGRWIVVLKRSASAQVERFDTEAQAHSFRQHMLESGEVNAA